MKKDKLFIKNGDLSFLATDKEKPFDAEWEIHLNNDTKDYVGKFSFEGKKEAGTIPFYIQIEPLYRDKNYATQTIRRMAEWAFSFANIYEIKVVIEHENSAAVTAFQKAGYVLRSATKELETYSITRQKSAWTGLYVAIGVVAGLMLGILFSNLYIGFAFGIIGGVAAGTSMDAKTKKLKEKYTGKK